MRASRVAVLFGACAAACSIYGDEESAPPVLPAENEAGIVDQPDATFSDVSLENVDSGVTVDGGTTPEKDAAKPLADLIVFVTSKTFLGNFGNGFPDDATDEICRAAGIGFYPRKFRALLSGLAIDARERVLKLLTGHRIVLPNGSPVAKLGENMLGSQLLQPISLDENNGYWPPSALVWTGMDLNGAPSASVCGNWNRSGSDVKGAGGSSVISSDWSYGKFDTCDTPHHLYCFEIP